MKTRLIIKGWERIRTSFWFVPSAMLGGAVVLFLLTISVDYHLKDGWQESVWYVYAGGSDGARALLSTVAGSMITVTGVVFSITIVAFTLASSQFSPRLLRNYMRDPGNQITLGTFIATFAYCLLVLRTVRGVNEHEFVPHASVTCAVLLAFASIGILIFFIHHASTSIQAQEIVATLGRELEAAVPRIFPSGIGKEGRRQDDLTPDEKELLARLRAEGRTLVSPESNYLQGIDGDHLLTLAEENDLVVEVLFRPGQFVTADQAVFRVWPADRPVERLSESLVFGSQRTGTQDFEYVIDQIVEVALRALSPSLNDPFTAQTCIDRLGGVMAQLAGKTFPGPYRYGAARRLRIITPETAFPSLLDTGFHQIRQSARGNAAVLIRLLETLGAIARSANGKENREAIARHAEMVTRCAEESLPERNDREDALTRLRIVRRCLSAEPSPG